MKKNIVLLIAHEGYQPIEYGVTREILASDLNINVITASDEAGTALAKDSSSSTVDMTVEQINPTTIDGLFIIGGPGALTYLDKTQVYTLLQQMMALKKPYGAICIASRILAAAGVLAGKKATGWDGDNELADIFKTHAVTYVKQPGSNRWQCSHGRRTAGSTKFCTSYFKGAWQFIISGKNS